MKPLFRSKDFCILSLFLFTQKLNAGKLRVGVKMVYMQRKTKQSNEPLSTIWSDEVSVEQRRGSCKKNKHWERLIKCIGFEDGGRDVGYKVT